tara:strand:+ start:677 stop:1330 length:654 start_codon:yes stop_codon:yes gene_type:complete
MKPKKCAIVSTPRSGTHYLRISLNNHPKMEFASEFFRPENKYRTLPKYKKHFQIKDYIYKNTIDPSIAKLNYVGFVWHLTLSSDLPLSKIDKFILLKRRNILGQLTSLMIATRTNCWRDKKSTHQIELNIAQLEWFIDREKKAHAAFESSGVEYKTVFYEDLCENFDETVKSIQDYLDLDYIRLEPAPLIKQETRPIQEIISNYEDVKWTLRDMNLH